MGWIFLCPCYAVGFAHGDCLFVSNNTGSLLNSGESSKAAHKAMAETRLGSFIICRETRSGIKKFMQLIFLKLE
jgi:hypothetical protein